MQPKRSSRFDEAPATPPPFRFFDNGEFAGEHEKADLDLSRFVTAICRTRRETAASPAEIASIIAASEHAHSFNPDALKIWGMYTEHEQWPYAQCFRSIEQAVKDGGKGVGGCEKLHLLRHPATDFEAREARDRFTGLVSQISTAWGGTRR